MSHGRAIERLFWITGWVYDFSKLATILLVAGLIIHYFFLTALVVKGTSMVPNYRDGQVLVIDKVSYRLREIKRGDVVAMFFPGEKEKRFIKRVIGLPGENVSIANGRVFINNRELREPYLGVGIQTQPNQERYLQGGEYFVLGDNRSVSSDSRAWGTVPRSFIIGRIPTSSDTILKQPTAHADQ